VTELPKIVVQRLQTATNAVHLDPDVITAFIEKSLSERERDQALGHLAQCRDCREIVALSLPEHEAVLPAAVSVRPAWLAWPVLRWGALVACVVVVGTAVTLHRQFRASSPSGLLAGRSDAPKVDRQALQTATPPGANAMAAGSIPQAPEAKANLTSARKKAESFDKKSLKGLVATEKGAKPPAPIPGLRDLNSIPAQTEAEGAGSSGASVITSSNAMDEAVPGRAKDAVQPSASAGAMAVGAPMAAKPAAAMAQSAVVAKKAFAASIGLPPRWTLSAEGTLQRSLDSGRTWETIPVAGQTSFRALAADELEIWVGGAKGALYHSSDAGQHWTQVQPAANGEVLTGDIIGVEFTDRLNGTVTTYGQQKWVTADAGQSWQKQKQ